MASEFSRIYNAIRDEIATVHLGDGDQLSDQNMLIRKWDNVQPELLEDCIAYLREYTSEKNGATQSTTVTDLKVHRTILEGLWRGGKISHRRDDNGKYTIFQELHQGYVESVYRTYVLQISSFDADPDIAGLRLYDSGVDYNDADVYYGENGIYAYWTSTSKGQILTAIEDVGNEDVENYFQNVPSEITVSGTSVSAADGTYSFEEFVNDRPSFFAFVWIIQNKIRV